VLGSQFKNKLEGFTKYIFLCKVETYDLKIRRESIVNVMQTGYFILFFKYIFFYQFK